MRASARGASAQRGRTIPQRQTVFQVPVPPFTNYYGGAKFYGTEVVGFIKAANTGRKSNTGTACRPRIGPARRQHHGITKEFNERTKNDMGLIIPVVITFTVTFLFLYYQNTASGSLN